MYHIPPLSTTNYIILFENKSLVTRFIEIHYFSVFQRCFLPLPMVNSYISHQKNSSFDERRGVFTYLYNLFSIK